MALQQAGVELVANGLSGFVSDMGKANSAVSGFGDTGKSAGSAFEKGFGQVAIGALREVGALAVDALGKAAVAVGGFVKDSIGLAGDFQSGMQEFQAVAGQDVDTKGLEEFHDLFLQLGKDLPVSTSDVQKAAIEMVKGGISPATVAAGGLRQNIQFAAAAMDGDLAAAAEVSAKILGGWAAANATAADKSKFLTDATDLLTKAANASSVDVHELSLGIFNAQGIAKAAGVGFEDLTTTLAELAPRFASSSEAGTSLKNVIARLQPTTDPAISAMTALGLYTEETGSAFYDAQGNFVGFAEASRLLKDATKDLTNEQRTQLLQTIFGNDAMSAASALAELGAEGYQKMADSLDKANGVAANAALKQQGYNTALENAKGSVEALQITLGEKLLPILTDFLNNVVAPGVNLLTTFTDAVFGNDEAFNKLSPTLQSVITIIDAVTEGFSEGGLLGAINQLIPGIFGTDDAAATLANQFQDSLGTAIEVLSDLWTGTLSPALDEVGGVLQEYIIPIIKDLALTIFPLLMSALKVGAAAWTNILLPVITTIWNFFKTYILPILADVAHWLKDNVPPAVAVLAKFLSETLFPALNKVWAFTDKNLIPILVAVAEVLGATVGLAVKGLAGLWEKVLWPALKEVGGWISRTLGPVLRDFGTWLNTVTGGVEGVSRAIQGVIRWIKDMADAIKNIELPSWLTPGSPTPWEIALLSLADALANAVTPALDSFQGALEAVGKVGPVISGLGGAALGRINDEISTQKQNLEWVTAAIEKLADQPTDLTETDMQRLNALKAERLRLEREIADETGRATAYQKKQDDLGFLQQQMKLLEFIRDSDLDANNLLAGVTLGVDADPNAILDLMTKATSAAVDQLATQIGIQTGTIAPPASSGQILDYSAAMTYNGQVGDNTINMPVYTNNSPDAVQQSAAVLSALMQ